MSQSKIIKIFYSTFRLKSINLIQTKPIQFKPRMQSPPNTTNCYEKWNDSCVNENRISELIFDQQYDSSTCPYVSKGQRCPNRCHQSRRDVTNVSNDGDDNGSDDVVFIGLRNLSAPVNRRQDIPVLSTRNHSAPVQRSVAPVQSPARNDRIRQRENDQVDDQVDQENDRNVRRRLNENSSDEIPNRVLENPITNSFEFVNEKLTYTHKGQAFSETLVNIKASVRADNHYIHPDSIRKILFKFHQKNKSNYKEDCTDFSYKISSNFIVNPNIIYIEIFASLKNCYLNPSVQFKTDESHIIILKKIQ